MLGRLVAKIIGLHLEVLRSLYDLVEKLSGEAGQEWLTRLKKFLRKENYFTRPISGNKPFMINAVSGTETLADAHDVFGHIDPNFKNWGTDKAELATTETTVEIYEMKKDATFSQIFGELSTDIRNLCFTQHQIKNFVKKYYHWLKTAKCTTFFLFKSKRNFFVALVSFSSGGEFFVYIREIGLDCVWTAKCHIRVRVVVPKLA
jgi:hypothetical protein